jgi:hypothetical protein
MIERGGVTVSVWVADEGNGKLNFYLVQMFNQNW